MTVIIQNWENRLSSASSTISAKCNWLEDESPDRMPRVPISLTTALQSIADVGCIFLLYRHRHFISLAHYLIPPLMAWCFVCVSFDGSFAWKMRWCCLRPTVLGQDWSESKIIGLGLVHCGLDLAGLVSCCETRSCHAHRHDDLENDTATFQVLFIVSLFCTWNITTVTYCEDQQ